MRRLAGAFGLALALAAGLGCAGPDGTRRSNVIDDAPSDHPKGGSGRDGGIPSNPGELVIEDVLESSCTPLAAPCVEVYERKAMTALHSLQPAGERWMAEAIWESGFVLFDADGRRASPELITTGKLDRAKASAVDIHVATVDDEGVKARVYDLTGAPLGPLVSIANERADRVAIGRNEAASLVVWATPDRVMARGMTTEGPSPDAFELETNVWKDGFFASIADGSREEFAVAWSGRRVADSHHRVFFVRANESGVIGAPRMLIDSLDSHRVIELEKTQTGFVLLLEQQDAVVVMSLSRFGEPSGPAYRFLGTKRAHGLAVNDGGDMLLSVLLQDGRDAVRLLDASGAPKDDWLCLHAYSSDTEHAASVAPTASGFAVLYRSVAAQQLLIPIDVIDSR